MIIPMVIGNTIIPMYIPENTGGADEQLPAWAMVLFITAAIALIIFTIWIITH